MTGQRAGRCLGLLAAASAAFAPGRSAADPAASVPLRENFSLFEQGLALAAAAGGLLLVGGGPSLLPAPAPSMGVPAPDSLDARLSRRLYRPGQGRFLAGAPDLMGVVLPLLPALAYALPLLAPGLEGARNGEGHGPWNPGHRLLAYAETIGWTYLLTGSVKYAVGRARPYTESANNHPELRPRPGEDNLAFFSGHASGMFAAGSFITEDVSRYLRRTWLSGSTPAARFWLGSALPYTVGYGLPTLVGLSRIIDQQHWPSDVLVGALVGTLVGHLAYAAHFDEQGQPRRRSRLSAIRPQVLVQTGLQSEVQSGVHLDGPRASTAATFQIALTGPL